MKLLLLIIVIGLAVFGIVLYQNPKLIEHWMQDTGLAQTSKTVRVYKWRDPSGRWQITDLPPAQGTDYEIRTYRTDDNILPLPPQLQPQD